MRIGSRASAFRLRFVSALAAMYAVVVLIVALWPTPVDRGLDVYIDRVLQELHERGVPSFVDYGFIEFSANIVFFVPVGFLAALLLGSRRWWIAILIGGLFSSAIEVTQGSLLPDRVPSVADVVANTTGAFIGCLAATAIRMLIRHRDLLVIADVLEGRRTTDGRPDRG